MASLEQLIAESGHSAHARVEEFGRLAAAVQAQRVTDGASNTRQVTRSTALWALMRLDTHIAAALTSGGINEADLADALSIRPDAGRTSVDEAQLHADFARALRVYLAGLSGRRSVELADLALAIVRAARDGDGGLLPGLLKRLNVDYGALVSAIDRLIPAAGNRSGAYDPAEFSQSVRRMRDRIGGDEETTATRMAEVLQELHPEYGKGAFGAVRFTGKVRLQKTVDTWLQQVRLRYDMDEVARSRHRVIDGELTLLGLAVLDHDLAQDLSPRGVLRALWRGAEVRPPPSATTRTEWAHDGPTDQDLLGREWLAEALVQRLMRLARRGDRSGNSFLIHVDGPWGAGKSTLFVFLRQRLRSHGYLVVEVNAWRDQRIGLPWWTILCVLRDAIVTDRPWYARPFARLSGLVDRVRVGWVSVTAVALVLMAALFVAFVVMDLNLESGGKAADQALKIVSLLSAAVAGLVAAVRFLLPSSRRSARAFIDTSDNPMRDVGRLFGRTLRRAKKPVVFLVDDLDRCTADHVVEFLEVMQTVVRQAKPYDGGRLGPYAFVAADGQWIRASYQHHYELFAPSAVAGRPLGYLFLEKVFQLHFRLPSITAGTRAAFLARLLAPGQDRSQPRVITEELANARKAIQNAASQAEVLAVARRVSGIADPEDKLTLLGEAAVKISEREIYEQTENDLQAYAEYLEPNPRSMVLFVNTHGVLQSLRILEGNFVNQQSLALWTVIEIRWPRLADYLYWYPETVELSQTEAAVPEDVKQLLQLQDVKTVLGDPRWGGPLTADLIRESAGVQ